MFARVVRFEGADLEQRKQAVEGIRERAGSGPPPGVPAKRLLVLTDENSANTVSITFYETEHDMKQGHETLNGMDPPIPGAMGKRVSVDLCEVAFHVEA